MLLFPHLVTDKENQTYRVDGVQCVNNKIENCHERDQHQFIPGTELTTVRRPVIVPETVQRPNNHDGQIHHCCQNIVDDCYNVKGEWDTGGQISKAEQDYDDGKDETQGVHSDAPLELWAF